MRDNLITRETAGTDVGLLEDTESSERTHRFKNEGQKNRGHGESLNSQQIIEGHKTEQRATTTNGDR